jgi:hypothetical protein
LEPRLSFSSSATPRHLDGHVVIFGEGLQVNLIAENYPESLECSNPISALTITNKVRPITCFKTQYRTWWPHVTRDSSVVDHVTQIPTLQKISIPTWSTCFRFPQLTSLTIQNRMEDWSLLIHLTNLKRLRTYFDKCPPPEIPRNFTNLTSLALHACQISDLLQMSQLQSLYLGEPSRYPMDEITRLTNLRSLIINTGDFFMNDPLGLTKLSVLTRLSLWASKPPPMLSLRGLSSLRSLCLYALDLDLSTLPLKLETLQLSLLNQPTKSAYKKNIPVLTNLTFLELWDLSWIPKNF